MSTRQPWSEDKEPLSDRVIEAPASEAEQGRAVYSHTCPDCGTSQFSVRNPQDEAHNRHGHADYCELSPAYRLKVKLAKAAIASELWIHTFELMGNSRDATKVSADIADMIWREIEKREK